MKRVLKTIRALVSVARDQVDGKITLTHWRHQLVDVADLAEAEAYANQMALQFGGRVAFAGKAPKPRKRSTLISCEAPSEYKLEQRAIEYARWLADRDSIKLPVNGKEQVIWGSVTSLTRKSSAGRAIRERRIKAVYFGDVQVPIPHWDWQPVCLAEPDDARPPVRESVPVAA